MNIYAKLEHDVPLFVITGPTASGKTSAAIAVAQKLGAEIVGADSMQVYRGMDIGTDTPDEEDLQGVPHHLINIVNPDDEYDGVRFCEDADKVIADIHGRGKRVVVAGGTGMYLRLLLKGIQSGPAPNPELRAELEERAERLGWPKLHEELAVVDEGAAQRLHPNDGVRIVRALEVYLQSGKPMTQWQAEHQFQQDRYRFAMVGIGRERELLNERINRRVDEMMGMGFQGEVEGLYARYGGDVKPMQGLGYKRLVEHTRGACSLAEAVEQIKTDTRRFAKRQRTWFKKEPMEWLDSTDEVLGRAFGFWLD